MLHLYKIFLDIFIEGGFCVQIKIIRNRIKCKFCGDILESKSRLDVEFCSCDKDSIDGGQFYLKRSWYPGDWEELSEIIEIN